MSGRIEIADDENDDNEQDKLKILERTAKETKENELCKDKIEKEREWWEWIQRTVE